MSFSVVFQTTKEDIFEKEEKKCEKQAQKLRSTGGIYLDPDFPPDDPSCVGRILDRYDKPTLQDMTGPWCAPHTFSESLNDDWCVYNDPWPFHVEQGNLGDCGLIAAIQCIARRKELLEFILPDREYIKDCGIVHVRLFVNGKWEVIKFDYHIPQYNRRQVFARTNNNQLWVSFIEKAFAKIKGSYANLKGISCTEALTCLTGCPSTLIMIDKDKDLEDIWEDFIKYYSSGFVMAAATPYIEEESEEKKVYVELNLENGHAYSILDFKQQDDHRLILIGSTHETSPTTTEFLPIYEDEIHNKLSACDQKKAENKLFWFRIEDFIRYFYRFYICEYKEPMFEKCFLQNAIIPWEATESYGNHVLCLDIKERQKFEFEVCVKQRGTTFESLILNIHKGATKNDCGELIHSFLESCDRLTTEPVFLDPGTYTLFSVYGERFKDLSLEWIVRSPTPLDGVSMYFNMLPDSDFAVSLQTMIAKNGLKEKNEKDEVVIYNWFKNRYALFMVENLSETNYLQVRPAALGSVPPMSRRFVAMFSVHPAKKEPEHFEIKYEIFSWYRNHLTQLRYRLVSYVDDPDDDWIGLNCPVALK